MEIDGSCHCGAIAFAATVDRRNVGLCHCTDCQQLTGTAFRTTVMTERGNFRLVRGTPRTYVKLGANGNPRHQLFCADCGSPLCTTGEGVDAAWIGIRWGAIRQRAALSPTRQIWCASAAGWLGTIAALSASPRD